MKKPLAILIVLMMVLPVSGLAVDAVSSATVSITEVPETVVREKANTLVIWFSTNDTVKAVALTAADAMEADSFEIVPEQPYTEADLAYYTDGRCDREQADASARPAIYLAVVIGMTVLVSWILLLDKLLKTKTQNGRK